MRRALIAWQGDRVKVFLLSCALVLALALAPVWISLSPSLVVGGPVGKAPEDQVAGGFRLRAVGTFNPVPAHHLILVISKTCPRGPFDSLSSQLST